MMSGGIDPISTAEIAGGAIKAFGGLLGGLVGDDEQPPAGMTTMNDNKRLALALMKARLKNKLNLPMTPNLPQFDVNPTPNLSSSLAAAKQSSGY